MTAPKKRTNVRRSPITRSKWDKMLAAYRERPTIKNVALAGDVGTKTAKRAIREGWPDLSLPPFIELATSGTNVHKEMAVYRESWEEAAMTKGEATRRAAEEGMAARITMDAAVRSMRMTQGYAERVLEKIDNGDLLIPEKITPRLVGSLVRSMESAANIVEKAMRIERMRAGEPEAVLGIQIGMMLERCNEEELEYVMRTGAIPARIIGQREAATQAVKEEAIDAEYTEQEERAAHTESEGQTEIGEEEDAGDGGSVLGEE